MSNNPIPNNKKVLLALAEDCFDGCGVAQDDVGLKQTRQADLGTLIEAIKGNVPSSPPPPGSPPPPPPLPPTPGLNYLYDQAKVTISNAEAAVADKDEEVRQFLVDAHSVLEHPLGKAWSPEWPLAGFTMQNSTAVPDTRDVRFNSIGTIAIYLALHPTYEIPPGGALAETTSARAQALHGQLSDARQAVNQAKKARRDAKNARDDAFAVLRKRLIAFVDELTLLLGPEDPRWEIFGLNIPASPRAPDPASDLVLSLAGANQVLAEWKRGTRSNNNRVLTQIVGVDPDFSEHGKSGDSAEKVIKPVPGGSVLKVKIIALNGSLEASSGPEAQISVP